MVGLENVPAFVALSDTVSMLGSGMTVKFFPLFFGEDLHWGPVGVNLIYVLGPLGIAAGSILAQKLAMRIGRIETVLVTKFMGVSLLVGLSFTQNPWAVTVMYLLRTVRVECGVVLRSYAAIWLRAKFRKIFR